MQSDRHQDMAGLHPLRFNRSLCMHYRTLGQTGLQVSEVGLGAMPFGGMVTRPDGTQFGWSGTDDQELIALVHRSEELGVNLLDTAAAYGNGHGEAVVGEALQGRRAKWIVATKVNPNQGIDADTPDEAAVHKRITESCEQSYIVSRRTTSIFINCTPFPTP